MVRNTCPLVNDTILVLNKPEISRNEIMVAISDQMTIERICLVITP